MEGLTGPTLQTLFVNHGGGYFVQKELQWVSQKGHPRSFFEIEYIRANHVAFCGRVDAASWAAMTLPTPCS